MRREPARWPSGEITERTRESFATPFTGASPGNATNGGPEPTLANGIRPAMARSMFTPLSMNL